MSLDVQKLKESARKQQAHPPAPDGAIRDAEVRLGFAIPAPLRHLYSHIGNGGFGPGHGFYGLASGTELFPDESVVYLYTLFREGDPENIEVA